MNTTRKLGLASGLAMTLIISACGGNNDNRDANANAGNSAGVGAGAAVGPGAGAGTGTGTGTGGGNSVTATVPDSAKANGNNFIGFLNSLKNDETSEPLVVGDGFAVPADETTEPRPLG